MQDGFEPPPCRADVYPPTMTAHPLGPLAVDATAWLALLLYPAVFFGSAGDGLAGRLPFRLFTLGAAVFTAHVVLAFVVHYQISHQVALEEVARQTESLTGVSTGFGLYLNYLFSALWILEASWWWASPATYAARPVALTAAIHGFFLFMIVNGAVVFVPWPRRALGLAILLVCLTAVGRRLRGRSTERAA